MDLLTDGFKCVSVRVMNKTFGGQCVCLCCCTCAMGAGESLV